VNGLVDKLHPSANFMVELRSILTATEPVERSLKMLTGTMALLDAVIGHPDNVRPKSDSGEDLDHICHLCQGIAGKIKPVADKIDESLGKALERARSEVNEKLTGQEVVDLQQSLKDGVDPMNEVRDGVMDGVGQTFIKDNLFKDIEDILGLVATVVFLVSCLAFIPLTCAFCAVSSTVCCSKRKVPAANGNIYRALPHRCACCSFCCGVLIATLPLLIAPIFSAVVVPLASVCIVLDDLKGDTFDKWAPALGVDKSESESMLGMRRYPPFSVSHAYE
jgi:hypothetical protein